MNTKNNENLIRICCTKEKKKADEWSLVLNSMDIPYTLKNNFGSWTLLVKEKHKNKAKTQIELFETENKKKIPEPDFQLFNIDLPSFLLIPLILITFHIFTKVTNFEIHWLQHGGASAEHILNGEWWRSVTALTLHLDFRHLISNMALGSIIAFSLARLLGVGLSLFLILISGIGGNLINAMAYGSNHNAIGASTAIFGAIGILGALQLIGKYRQKKRKKWVPLAASLALLGFIGTSGARTDVTAHLFGFITGIVLGFSSALSLLRFKIPGKYIQACLYIICALVTILCWLMAFKIII